MSTDLEGKVALITGAARGQGRSHAVALAQRGADVAICDLNSQPETVAEVERLGRRVVSHELDIRDGAALDGLAADAMEAFGRIDIVVGNAAIFTNGAAWEISDDDWDATIGVNLTGAWRTAKAAIPHMIAGGDGGAIVFTGSGSSQIGFPGTAHYNASKHGLVGLMRTLANELAPYRIRVNCVSPSAVNTPMIMNEEVFGQFAQGKPAATIDDAMPALQAQNALPNPWIEPVDVSNAILFLVAETGRYITGVDLPVDSGTRVLPPGMAASAWRAALAEGTAAHG